MRPKRKILILSGCILTMAVMAGGTFFVQKSRNGLPGSTPVGKSHEAAEHTTGYIVCQGWTGWSEQTGLLQEIFAEKRAAAEKELQEILETEQTRKELEETEKEKEKEKEELLADRTKETDTAKKPAEESKAQTGIQASAGTQGTGMTDKDPEENPAAEVQEEAPVVQPAEQPTEEPQAQNLCPYPLWTVMSFEDGTMGYYWPMDFDIADAARVDQELAELHYIKLVSTTFVGNYDDAYHVRLSKFIYFIPPLA